MRHWLGVAGRAVLVAALLLTPAGRAAGQASRQPLGVVLEGPRARIGTTAAVPGTTIFSGDLLSTEPSSALAARLGNSRLILLENSSAAVHSVGKNVVVELERGALVFSTTGSGEALAIWVSDIQVLTGATFAVAGEVRMVSGCELLITSWRGPLLVRNGRQSVAVEEQTVRVTPEHSITDRGATRVSPEDRSYHRAHTHQNCPAPAAAAKDPTLPVGLVTAGAVTALLVRFLGSPSPFRP